MQAKADGEGSEGRLEAEQEFRVYKMGMRSAEARVLYRRIRYAHVHTYRDTPPPPRAAASPCRAVP